MTKPLLAAFSPLALLAASCSPSTAGDTVTRAAADVAEAFTVTELARFDEPWAMALDPVSKVVFVTEMRGTIKFVEPGGGFGTLTGGPQVAYGGQGGLGDTLLAPPIRGSGQDRRAVYLSWAEPGLGDTRGAAVGRGDLICEEHDSCRLQDFRVIWRQDPKTTGQGHYSHRLAFSPDGQHLYVASGDRQKLEPAQDLGGNLGKIVRLNLDGTPAPGNPFAAQGGVAAQVWSLGHRNILGLKFDAEGRLWDLEHGPAGGDELNLVKPGANYGWPLVSQGNHYGGGAIPRHATRPDLAAPAIWWNPVIGPGDFIFYKGAMFPEWRGQALIAGLVSEGLVRVKIEGESAREEARYPLGKRIRSIVEADDGALMVLEDGPGGRLLRLSRR